MHWLYNLPGTVWAYILIGAISNFTEELAPIGGGYAAHNGRLGLMQVAISVCIGTWATGIGLYYLGRARGIWLRRRFPNFGRLFTRALMVVRRRPWRASLAVRYAFGLRITLPIACGAAHVPIWEYAIGSAISSVTWSSLFTVVGWMFGRSADVIMRHIHRFEDLLTLAAVGAVGILLFAYLRRSAAHDDEAITEFGRELDRLSGEFPVLTDEENHERRRRGTTATE
ncbi:MAG TPA: VTT domain-containing protein [Gemmatimonadaceae bacterium]|nr:VTT domain-containing protein [Gemmatimonadaceae bacterium]